MDPHLLQLSQQRKKALIVGPNVIVTKLMEHGSKNAGEGQEISFAVSLPQPYLNLTGATSTTTTIQTKLKQTIILLRHVALKVLHSILSVLAFQKESL